MKFEYPKDYKTFMIGLIASLSAVALWDVIKSQYKIKPTSTHIAKATCSFTNNDSG